MKTPTNIHVNLQGLNSKKAAAGWNMDGARFHVWFNVDSFVIDDGSKPVIYKNPPEGMDRNDPTYFDTRKLNAASKNNAEILGVVFQEVTDRGLIALARKEEEQKEAKRQAESKEWARQERIKEAGPRLAKALRDTLNRLANVATEDATKDEQFCKIEYGALLNELGE